MDVRDDGILCLEINEQPVGIEEAAIKILDPFLFPESPRKY